jgi:hypothetical protein
MQIVGILAIENNLARVELDDGSIIDGAKIIYPAGFFANIEIDGNSLGMLFKDGNNDYAFVLPINIVSQPLLAINEVALGNFKQNKTIKIASDITLNADTKIAAKFETTNETKLQGKLFLTHTHSGVQSGGSNTGSVV